MKGNGDGDVDEGLYFPPSAISKVCALLAKPNLINYTNALALAKREHDVVGWGCVPGNGMST